MGILSKNNITVFDIFISIVISLFITVFVTNVYIAFITNGPKILSIASVIASLLSTCFYIYIWETYCSVRFKCIHGVDDD